MILVPIERWRKFRFTKQNWSRFLKAFNSINTFMKGRMIQCSLVRDWCGNSNRGPTQRSSQNNLKWMWQTSSLSRAFRSLSSWCSIQLPSLFLIYEMLDDGNLWRLWLIYLLGLDFFDNTGSNPLQGWTRARGRDVREGEGKSYLKPIPSPSIPLQSIIGCRRTKAFFEFVELIRHLSNKVEFWNIATRRKLGSPPWNWSHRIERLDVEQSIKQWEFVLIRRSL